MEESTMKNLIPWNWSHRSLPLHWVKNPALDLWSSNWDELFNSFSQGLNLFSTGSDTPRTRSFSPRLDLEEDEKKYVLSAELPGMDEKDIDLSIENQVLTIKGEKKEEKEEKTGNYHHVERHYGSFCRSFEIPEGVDLDKIEALFNKGVLKIDLPKTPQAQKVVKKIAVQAA
jgi:HSP20 family protein